jgi:hypothetical protein
MMLSLEGMACMAMVWHAPHMHACMYVHHLQLLVCFLFINASSSLNPIPYRRSKNRDKTRRRRRRRREKKPPVTFLVL